MPERLSVSPNLTLVYWVDSTGRRNTLSAEVSDGQACGVDDDVDWAAGDALTGVPADSS
ncbi:hypothetical protein [Mycobacterium sp.]|uniref:hypothetical protein n=1 Tax=Mycobacterium sp. TaxID=1785 RepID=UPI003F9AAF8F